MHYGPLPRQSQQPWSFNIGGYTQGGNEQSLSLTQLLTYPTVEVTADMHCGTRWSVLNQHWKGVRTSDLVQDYPPAPGIRHALVFAEYGYAANVHLDDLVSPRSLLATHWNGEPLTLERGAPLRLIIPELYTWKGPKWVRGWNYLEQENEELGFWEGRGYHIRGNAWREQRYSYHD